MGKQVSTLKMTGSFAGAVGYIDQQRRVQMRSKPEAYHDANTKEQRVVRTKFLAISSLAQACKNVALGLTPQAKSKGISLRNMFVKANYRSIEVSADQQGNLITDVDYTLLELARGTNPLVSFGSPDFNEPLSVVVNFTPNTDLPGADASDLVYIAAFNPGDGRAMISTPVRRDLAAHTITLQVPNSWNGETVHVYGFTQGFKSEAESVKYLSMWNDPSMTAGEAMAMISKAASGTEFSDSHYIGNGSIS